MENIIVSIISGISTIAVSMVGINVKKHSAKQLDAIKELSQFNREVEQIKLEKEIAYETYDMAAKSLSIHHARSYLVNNDRKKLESKIDETESARKHYIEKSTEVSARLERLIIKV
jgi:hypothetical protein